MALIGLYSFQQYTVPAGIPPANLTGDTMPNDPAAPDYNASATTWIGETFTFNGGPPSQIDIIDDDGIFEDEYVETGGAQTLAQDISIDGTLYPAGSIVENEFSLIDASGQEIYVVRISGQNVGFTFAKGEEPTAGQSFTAQKGLDGSPLDNADGASSSSEPYGNIACYAQGTLIQTPEGPRPVETLRVGNLVQTRDRGSEPVLWIRRHHQMLGDVTRDQKPVLISAGALGPGCPRSDLVVSSQHRILVGGNQLSALFTAEAFAPAKSLTRLPGIRHMHGRRHVTWVHFAFESHEVISANGCLTESLLLGPMVVNGLARKDLRVLADVFGPPASRQAFLNGPPARKLMTVGAVRAIIKHGEASRGAAKPVQNAAGNGNCDALIRWPRHMEVVPG